MADSSPDGSAPIGKNSMGKKKFGTKSKLGGFAIAALVAIYSLAAPKLNERYNWDLPQIQTDRSGNVQLASNANETTAKNDDSATAGAKPTAGASDKAANGKPGPLAGKMATSNRSQSKSQSESQSQSQSNAKTSSNQDSRPPPTSSNQTDSSKKTASSDDEELLYGILREVSKDRYISPAGLMYTPGSAEGHRLEHLRRHTKDDPGRPGSHGVFDGDMDGALATIDRAYDRAKKGQRTTKSVDDGRTIYTVDMGGRVGYVGGRTGKQKRNPMARRVRVVLEGNRVITAYPM